MQIFDVIVIGKGLVGAAAAKYLSENTKKVAVIGADEPKETETPLVYSSHYDQARVQRIIGKDKVWTTLNNNSVQEYASIQKKSGIRFHDDVGCLYVNAYGPDHYLKNYPTVAKTHDISYTTFGSSTALNSHADFVFPETSAGILEHAPSGYINPRLLIKAQLEVFKQQGGSVFSDTVIKLSVENNGTFLIETESGKTYSSAQVLVATGSFMNCLDILPQKLKLTTKSEVVLLVKIDDKHVEHFRTLPSLLYEIDEEDVEGIYLLPPVKYPDGNYYLKIGANSPDDLVFESLEQIQEWFRNGKSERYAPALLKAIRKLMPSLPLENTLTKKCVISRTATGRPYVGETATQGLFLAGGCNGYSAMCSDAIGNVASHLILNGKLPEYYPTDAFTIEYMEEESDWI
ncbi:MAG: FAD-dependent oxidoreductase [Spirosomataceae bacterium]